MALPNLRRLRGSMTLEELSGETGISVSQLSRYERGGKDGRDPKLAHLRELARALSTSMDEITGDVQPVVPPGTVPLVGYVGAGAAYHAFDPGGEIGRVREPDGATADTVAVEVRGTSLGELFDRWLVYYDQVRTPPTRDELNKLCVVGLADGRVLVKKLVKGQLPGHFNLHSNTEPPIYDAVLEWCAVVKQMSPR